MWPSAPIGSFGARRAGVPPIRVRRTVARAADGGRGGAAGGPVPATWTATGMTDRHIRPWVGPPKRAPARGRARRRRRGGDAGSRPPARFRGRAARASTRLAAAGPGDDETLDRRSARRGRRSRGSGVSGRRPAPDPTSRRVTRRWSSPGHAPAVGASSSAVGDATPDIGGGASASARAPRKEIDPLVHVADAGKPRPLPTGGPRS